VAVAAIEKQLMAWHKSNPVTQIASHGSDYAMPNLLNHLAASSCNRLGSYWDRCGVHYVEPIEGAR
jgi:hypothetical protein